MKLISLNVEGHKHHERVFPFLEKEDADVLCLQEASMEHGNKLEALGYDVAFTPRCIMKQNDKEFEEGILLASKHPFTHKTYYYYKNSEAIPPEGFDESLGRKADHQCFIFAEIECGDDTYHIATNHFTWTPDGATPNKEQIDDMEVFLELVDTLPSHVMCGDFNVPRYHNSLYEKLMLHYKDTVPQQYKSSLDKQLHRIGENPEKSIIFESFMVDYVFTQSPYIAKDVRLEFNISDHAGVVCEIVKT